jgi:hypothetical protein
LAPSSEGVSFEGHMPQFVEKDPGGVETWTDDDHEPGLKIHYRQDVEPVLNYARDLRNNEDYSKAGIKRDFWLYATIPPVVIMKLKIEHGLDVFDPNHVKAVHKIINQDYPYLKCTTGHHGG